MPKFKPKAPPAQSGHNSDSLAAIGAKLRQMRDIFESGELLSRAKKKCKHGEFLPWLETYFDASEDTAERHIAAYDLSLKFRTVRNLKWVPLKTIYSLAKVANGLPESGIEARIKALHEATKGKTEPISIAEADAVIKKVEAAIRIATLRSEWGNYPEATLNALDCIDQDEEWAEPAIEALKEKKPTLKEAADKLVFDIHYEHVEKLYAEHGALPKNLDEESLNDLEGVYEGRRARVLERLLAEPQPLTAHQVNVIVFSKDEEQGEPPPESGKPDEPKSGKPDKPKSGKPDKPKSNKPKPEDQRNDVGADSKAEMKRLRESNDEFARKLATAEQSKQAAYRKIDELEDQLKAFKGDEPKGGIDRLANALIAALKKVARGKAEEVIEDLCKKLGVDPKKFSIEDKAA
jgi:hypothetical protein